MFLSTNQKSYGHLKLWSANPLFKIPNGPRQAILVLIAYASSEGSGETARMRRLAWTFAARIGYKYQIRLTRSKWCRPSCMAYPLYSNAFLAHWIRKSEILAWDRNSYLAQVISPRHSAGKIHAQIASISGNIKVSARCCFIQKCQFQSK